MSFSVWDTEPVLTDVSRAIQLRLVSLRFKHSENIKPYGATWRDSVRMTDCGAMIVFFKIANELLWDTL